MSQNLQTAKRKISGYCLLDMLIELIIILSFVSLIFPIFTLLKQLVANERYDYQQEIGIYQLQITLARYNIIEINEDEIIYEDASNQYCLHLSNDNLVATPGWQCFIKDVNYISFEKEDNIIYLEYMIDEEYRRYPIGYTYYNQES